MRKGMSAGLALLGAALLSGCAGSGFGTYVRDTVRLPGSHPNQPQGDGLNHQRVLGHTVTPAPEPVAMAATTDWPGPPKAIPSLQDLQRQQNEALASGTYAPHPMGKDLPSVPGFEVQGPAAPPAPPVASFPTGVVKGTEGANLSRIGGAEARTIPDPDKRGNIVVPNGDGTSTVIAPDGSVTTVPTPKK